MADVTYQEQMDEDYRRDYREKSEMQALRHSIQDFLDQGTRRAREGTRLHSTLTEAVNRLADTEALIVESWD